LHQIFWRRTVVLARGLDLPRLGANVPHGGSPLPAQSPAKRRWLRRLLLGLALTLTSAVAAILWLAAHLEIGWVRGRVRTAVAQTLGLEIDYDKARLGLQGFVIEGFSVSSMPVDRDLAPHLAHIDRIALAWRPGDLLSRRWTLTDLDITRVALNLVVDTAGRTSLERVLDALPEQPDEPKTPYSQLFQKLREQPALAVERVALTGLRIEVARRQLAGGVSKWRVGDMALDGRVQTGVPRPVLELNLSGPHLKIAQLLREIVPGLLEQDVQDLDLTGRVALPAPERLSVRLNLGAALRTELEVATQPGLRGLEVGLRQLTIGKLFKANATLLVLDAGQAELAQVIEASLTANAPELRVAGLSLTAPHAQFDVKDAHIRRALDQSTAARFRADVTWQGGGVEHPAGTGHFGAVHVAADGTAAQPGSARLRATGTVAQVEAAQLAGAATMTGVEFEADLAMLPEGVTLICSLPVAHLTAQAGAQGAQVDRLTARLRVETAGLAALLAEGLPALRALEASLDADQIHANVNGQTVIAEAPQMRLALPPLQVLPGPEITARGALQAAMRVGVLRAPGGIVVRDAGAEATVTDLHAIASQPAAATAHVTANVHVGTTTAQADVHKLPDTVRWHLVWDVPDFLPLLAIAPLPSAVRKAIDWQELSLSGRSDGHAEGPHVTQRTILDMRGVAQRRVAIPKIHAEFSTRGQGAQQDVDLKLDADLARVGKLRPGSVRIAGHGAWNPAAKTAKLDVRGKSAQGLDAALQFQARPHGADLAYTAAVHLAGLGGVVRGLPAVERDALCLGDNAFRMDLDAAGTLVDGATWLAGAGTAGTDGQHRIHGEVRHVACRRADSSADVKRAQWRLDARNRGSALEAEGQASVSELDAAGGGHRVHVAGWQQHFTARLAADGTAHLTTDGTLARIVQDALPGFPARDVTFSMSGWNGTEQARIDAFELDNPASGTHVTLRGGLDRTALKPPRVQDADVAGEAAAAAPSEQDKTGPVPGRLGLSLTGELRQDLAKLVHDEKIAGKGRVVVPFRVESGDLIVFRTDARVRFDDVDVDLDTRDVHIRGVRGEFPVVETFALTPTFALIGGGEDNAYARWRFADHQPFLRRDDFLSIASVQHRGLQIGPIAGNAGLDRDVFRLDQIEATLLQGKITGQCIVQALGAADSRVLLRGNATGLRVAGSDERFDANGALDFLPMRRSLDGRMEILHIGRKHLEALLDFLDPYREDANMNRVRKYLVLGHPEHVRMRFQHGFMDFAIELGGLGSLVKIEDVRGIALGPVFQRWLDPLLKGVEANP